MTRRDSQIGQQRWLHAVNTSSETIPAHACVRVVASGFPDDYFDNQDARRTYYEIEKPPDTDEDPYSDLESVTRPFDYAFVGHQPIPAGKVGRITFCLPTVALVASGDEDVERLLPLSNSFALARPQGGVSTDWFYRNLGLLREGEPYVLIQRSH